MQFSQPLQTFGVDRHANFSLLVEQHRDQAPAGVVAQRMDEAALDRCAGAGCPELAFNLYARHRFCVRLIAEHFTTAGGCIGRNGDLGDRRQRA